MLRINGQVMCAKCGKTVYKMDPFTGNIVFTVYCHNETESTVLTRSELESAISIDATIAFKG